MPLLTMNGPKDTTCPSLKLKILFNNSELVCQALGVGCFSISMRSLAPTSEYGLRLRLASTRIARNSTRLSNAQGSSSAPLLKTLGDASDIASDFVVIIWPLGERLVLLYVPTFNAPNTWDIVGNQLGGLEITSIFTKTGAGMSPPLSLASQIVKNTETHL